jgi:limonene-1,2-epoxide hydrolase
MGEQQEAVVRSLLDSLVAGDRDAAVDHFSDKATYNVSAWSDPLVGKDAIRAELERQAAVYSDLRYTIINVASTDTVVFTERLDKILVGGKEVIVHWASVHEVDPENKITATRDYYDMNEIETQLL